MQKLKNVVVDRMLTAGLTRAEIDFMLEISHYQDEKGRILGVYYKDICSALSIAYQTFYDSLRSLQAKGFLEISKASYEDWNVKILDNDFSYEGAREEGYVSTGHDIFFDNDFKALKANEKLLALQFLKINGANRGKSYRIEVNKFYKKYSKLLGVAQRTVQKYLCKLRKFFSIGIRDRLYWITPLKKVFKDKAPADICLYTESLGRVVCRRNKATYTVDGLKDTLVCIKEHMGEIKERIADSFLVAVAESIRLRNAHIKDHRNWNRELEPKFIHKLLLQEIQKQAPAWSL